MTGYGYSAALQPYYTHYTNGSSYDAYSFSGYYSPQYGIYVAHVYYAVPSTYGTHYYYLMANHTYDNSYATYSYHSGRIGGGYLFGYYHVVSYYQDHVGQYNVASYYSHYEGYYGGSRYGGQGQGSNGYVGSHYYVTTSYNPAYS